MRDLERLVLVGVQEHHLHLAAVAGIDQPGRVDEADPVPRRQSRPRENEARPAVGDRHRDPCTHARALAGLEPGGLCRVEVEPRVPGMRAGRSHRLRAEQRIAQVHSLGWSPFAAKRSNPARRPPERGPDADALGGVLAVELAGELVELERLPPSS